MKVALH